MRSRAVANAARILAVVLAASPVAVVAQSTPAELSEAFALERSGRHADAAQRYRAILGRSPTNLSALLGLERVLVPIAQLQTIVPHIDSALALQPENRSIRSLGLRVFAELQQPDDLNRAARAWIAAMPESIEPYREWSSALAQLGDTRAARRVLEEGAQRMGGSTLSQDMAELAVLEGEWAEAAQYWRDAATANASLAGPAVTGLMEAPAEQRQAVVDALVIDPDDHVGGRIAANLLVTWGRASEGWVILDRALPDDPQVAVALLRRFADRAGIMRSQEGSRARGFALERLAELSDGPAAQRARVEAARAFADGGERAAADRMLQQIARGDGRGGNSGTGAVATLIGVMAESGRVEEAEDRFDEWADRLTADEVGDLRRRIAWGWIRSDRLDRAESILGNDSTIAVLAVRGWIQLFHGDLRGATDLFRAAGPRAGSRPEATERTTMLALVQSIEPDSVPAVGGALLALARGDTTRAVAGLADAAAQVPPDGGRVPLLTFAGRIALEYDEVGAAEAHLTAALQADSTSASAPFAAYYLARVYAEAGRPDDAQLELERVILTYPNSAAVPLARRLLDVIRGGVPQP